MGPCRYTLVKNADGNVKDFEVIVTNEKARRNPDMSSTVAVDFIYDKHVIKLRSKGVALIDDVKTNGYTSDDIQIVVDVPNVIVTTNAGIVIRWDGRYLVEVDVTGDYFNHVEGLCGNYNSDKEDEFITRIGLLVEDIQKFGQSWHVKETDLQAGEEECHECVGCDIPEPCRDAAVKDKAQEICGGLISDTGPFQECLGTVNPETIFKNCMMDMCAIPDGLAYCDDYQLYAEKCAYIGITINWRRDDFCKFDCKSMGMLYSPMSPACPSNCANPTASLTCNTADRENCVCVNGHLKEGGKCVAIEECGCVHQDSGEYYRKGESVISKDCQTVCSCVGFRNLVCTGYSCGPNEYCGAKDGETLCLCEEKYFRDEATKKCLETPFPQTVLIPERQVVGIFCGEERFVNILDAHFGNPEQAQICLEVSGDKSCNAENSITQIKRICQGMTRCNIEASTQYFGEPCVKDFKYLHVEFSCEHKKISHNREDISSLRVCLDESVTLFCQLGSEIVLEEVFFGRHANDRLCLEDGEALPDAEHVSVGAIEVAGQLCNGKEFCTLKADTGVFGDPWVEGSEYLRVAYKCITPS